jgi:hypothetical protein
MTDPFEHYIDLTCLTPEEAIAITKQKVYDLAKLAEELSERPGIVQNGRQVAVQRMPIDFVLSVYCAE